MLLRLCKFFKRLKILKSFDVNKKYLLAFFNAIKVIKNNIIALIMLLVCISHKKS